MLELQLRPYKMCRAIGARPGSPPRFNGIMR